MMEACIQSLDPHDGRRERAPAACPLTSTCVPSTCTCLHICTTNKYKNDKIKMSSLSAETEVLPSLVEITAYRQASSSLHRLWSLSSLKVHYPAPGATIPILQLKKPRLRVVKSWLEIAQLVNIPAIQLMAFLALKFLLFLYWSLKGDGKQPENKCFNPFISLLSHVPETNKSQHISYILRHAKHHSKLFKSIFSVNPWNDSVRQLRSFSPFPGVGNMWIRYPKSLTQLLRVGAGGFRSPQSFLRHVQVLICKVGFASSSVDDIQS